MFLVPPFNAVVTVDIMHRFLAFGPSYPGWLGISQDTNHLIWGRQIGVDGRCKRMNQLRPMMVPQPEHSTAIGTEVTFRRTFCLVRSATILYGVVFLDEILSLDDFEAIGDTSQVDAAAIATNLAADAACTKLIRHRCLRIESKLHPAALAASFKFPVSTVSVVAGLIWTARRVCI